MAYQIKVYVKDGVVVQVDGAAPNRQKNPEVGESEEVIKITRYGWLCLANPQILEDGTLVYTLQSTEN